jgi:hypothetical protein
MSIREAISHGAGQWRRPQGFRGLAAPAGDTSVEKRTLAFNWTIDQVTFLVLICFSSASLYTQLGEIQKTAEPGQSGGRLFDRLRNSLKNFKFST